VNKFLGLVQSQVERASHDSYGLDFGAASSTQKGDDILVGFAGGSVSLTGGHER
jgi:hypothetical protein